MAFNLKYLIASTVLALMVCMVQIIGDPLLILICLMLFLLLVGWTSFQSYTLPILLFFLPWSQILKLEIETFSFYTFALILVCAVGVLQQRLRFKKYHLISVLGLMVLSLFTKLIDGSPLSLAYIAILLLLVMFPVVKEEVEYQRYDFFQVVVYFSVGIILAALCASMFAYYPNIRKYINIHSYLTITRTSGFYWDPNFYMAQISVAFGGCLVLLLKIVGKRRIVCLGCLLQHLDILLQLLNFSCTACLHRIQHARFVGIIGLLQI